MPRMLYDPTVDVLSVELNERGKTARTVEAGPGLHLDYDAKGRLLMIEILDASFHVPRKQLEQLANHTEWLTLTEAQEESGIQATTLRVQLNAGRMVGEKRGRDWYVARHELLNYMESRSSRGRKPASETKPKRQRRAAAKRRG